jgi:uncharacterized protein (UPF0335 family)
MAKTLRSEIPDQFGGVINEGALARYVERVERLHEERASLGEDIKAVMEEAKNAGFVPKIIRQMVRERKMEPVELQDHLALLDSYRRGLGMLAGTPLGDAAMDRAEAIHAAHPAPKRGRKPRSFAEQPVHQPRPRGRPRKNVSEALADARLHLGEEEPAGTA